MSSPSTFVHMQNPFWNSFFLLKENWENNWKEMRRNEGISLFHMGPLWWWHLSSWIFPFNIPLMSQTVISASFCPIWRLIHSLTFFFMLILDYFLIPMLFYSIWKATLRDINVDLPFQLPSPKNYHLSQGRAHCMLISICFYSGSVTIWPRGQHRLWGPRYGSD